MFFYKINVNLFYIRDRVYRTSTQLATFYNQRHKSKSFNIDFVFIKFNSTSAETLLYSVRT